MKKVFLILRHEFLHMVTGTGYIIITLSVLALPLLILLGVGVIQLAQGLDPASAPEPVEVGYVDDAGGFEGRTREGGVSLAPYGSREAATRALLDGTLDEYFVIPSDFTSVGLIHRYSLERELEAPEQIRGAIRRFLLGNLLEDRVPPTTLALARAPLRIINTTLSESGQVATEQGGFGPLIVPGIFGLLLALSLVTLPSLLAHRIGEEKESRLIEILLSSVSTRQLLAGKVLGLGAGGLLQVAIWFLIPALLLRQAADTVLGGLIDSLQITPGFLALAILYFILGYLFFAVLAAGVAAISPTARDGAQISVWLFLPALVPLWFSSLVMFFPNNPIWDVLTFVPITAPVMVMVRFGVTDIPAWELTTSIAIMLLSIIGGLLLASRLFRVYLLMYGKRPTLPEIVRSLRAA
jgi:ABC-2 type transport system permease protein